MVSIIAQPILKNFGVRRWFFIKVNQKKPQTQFIIDSVWRTFNDFLSVHQTEWKDNPFPFKALAKVKKIQRKPYSLHYVVEPDGVNFQEACFHTILRIWYGV